MPTRLLLQVLPLHAGAGRACRAIISDPVGDLASTEGRACCINIDGRALLITTGACAVHCRYCFRREFPYSENLAAAAQWQPALEALAADPSIREVMLSGGDPLSWPTTSCAPSPTDCAGPNPPHAACASTRAFPISAAGARIDAGFKDWLRSLALAGRRGGPRQPCK